MSKRHRGQCLLTEVHAPLVKSHIIPKALTRPEEPGEKFWEGGVGYPTRRKSSSWYDSGIVCRRGEDILSRIDDAAISELRRRRLVWSGLIDDDELDLQIIEEPHSVREVHDLDHAAVWLFFASVVWRASVSKRPELSHFCVGEKDEEALKSAIVGNAPLFDQYPAELIQLLGPPAPHNHTPIILEKTIGEDDFGNKTNVTYARVFADGLVCHFRLAPMINEVLSGNALFLGSGSRLVLYARPFEGSAQEEFLRGAIAASLGQTT